LEKNCFLLAGLYRDDFVDNEEQVISCEIYREPRWIKDRPTCLECDHLQFVSILDDLQEGNFRYLPDIVANYQRHALEEAGFTGDKNCPIGKVTYTFGYGNNKAAFPRYLDGLPCNLLVDYLAADKGNAKRLKKCPICKNFFYAVDVKREICYEPICRKKYEADKKRRQRESDPVKYV